MGSDRSVSRAALAPVMFAATMLAGCAYEDRVVFVTDTTLGVNAERTPPGVSVAYDRTEGVLGPTLPNGEMPGVYASIQTGGGLFDRNVRQVYATGRAAELITGKQPGGRRTGDGTDNGDGGRSQSGPSNDQIRLGFFGTETVVGVKIGYLSNPEPTLVPSTFTVGYKRRELSILPLKLIEGDAENNIVYPSTVAAIDNSVKAQDQSPFTMIQFFASGAPAVSLAGDSTFRKMFQNLALNSLSDSYKNIRMETDKSLVGAFECYSTLKLDQLSDAWKNANDLRLLYELYPSMIQRYRTATASGSVDYDTIKDINGDYVSALSSTPSLTEPDRPMRLDVHTKYVCQLAKGEA